MGQNHTVLGVAAALIVSAGSAGAGHAAVTFGQAYLGQIAPDLSGFQFSPEGGEPRVDSIDLGVALTGNLTFELLPIFRGGDGQFGFAIFGLREFTTGDLAPIVNYDASWDASGSVEGFGPDAEGGGLQVSGGLFEGAASDLLQGTTIGPQLMETAPFSVDGESAIAGATTSDAFQLDPNTTYTVAIALAIALPGEVDPFVAGDGPGDPFGETSFALDFGGLVEGGVASEREGLEISLNIIEVPAPGAVFTVGAVGLAVCRRRR